MSARSTGSKVVLEDVVIFDAPKVTLEDVVIFQSPRVASVASPFHARIAPFLDDVRPASGPMREEPGHVASVRGLVATVRERVAEAALREIDREHSSGRGVGIGGPLLQARVALGMMGAMADVRRRMPATRIGSVSFTRAAAVAVAEDLAASLSKRAFSAAGHALVATRVKLSALGKFASGATVHKAGQPSEDVLFSAAKPLALVAAAGVASFMMMGDAGAQSRDVRVRMQPTQSQADGAWLSASGITVNEPNMAFFGAPAAQPAPKAPPVAQGAQPGASRGGLVEVRPPVGKVERVDPPTERLIHVASRGFKEIASMVATTNLEDIEQGRALVDQLEAQGRRCVEAGGSGRSCRFERAGIVMDFSTGNFIATLQPMIGVSKFARPVAQETAAGLRIIDSEALALAKDFNESRVVELARRTGEIPEEEEADTGVTTPRR